MTDAVPGPLLHLVGQSRRVVLVPHLRPDGDALGATMGLALALESRGVSVLRLLQDDMPPAYLFLPGSALAENGREALDRFLGAGEGPVGVIALDCGDPTRLGIYQERLLHHHPLAVIDHHRSNDGFGDVSWVEPQRSSTGEMVYDLICALGWPVATDVARCLYTAIVTDTGSFRYENTSPHTFAVAGALLAAGVRPEEVALRVFETSSPARLRLLARTLETLRLHCGERVATIEVTRAMLAESGATRHDMEDFVNWPRSLATVEVAIFCRETEDEEQAVSVSLRAKGRCDVAMVAASFGGGGHRNAAGFRQRQARLGDVRDRVLEEVAARLASS